MFQIIIIGPPGVGKGTQAQLLSENLKLYHLSTGEVLREAAEKGTELGIRAKEVMDKGELVPDKIMIGIVKEALINNIVPDGFILDGFPRTLPQAEALMDILRELGFNEIKVLLITADEEELIRRLVKRGRSDDNETVIRNRLKIYDELTAPVIEFYRKNTEIITVYGLGEIESINKDILFKLSNQNQRNI